MVLEFIEEKNTEAIYEMLCERLKGRSDIKQQIQETFGFMNGNVSSYKTGYVSGDGKWSKDGKAKMSKGSSCDEIKTDTGNEYQLVVAYYDENDFETDLLGIFGISFVEVNPNNTSTDYFSKRFRINVEI